MTTWFTDLMHDWTLANVEQIKPDERAVEEHLKALNKKPGWKFLEPTVRDTGKIWTSEEIEERRLERRKRGDR